MGLFDKFRKQRINNKKPIAQSEQINIVVEDKTRPEYWLNELRMTDMEHGVVTEFKNGRVRIKRSGDGVETLRALPRLVVL